MLAYKQLSPLSPRVAATYIHTFIHTYIQTCMHTNNRALWAHDLLPRPTPDYISNKHTLYYSTSELQKQEGGIRGRPLREQKAGSVYLFIHHSLALD